MTTNQNEKETRLSVGFSGLQNFKAFGTGVTKVEEVVDGKEIKIINRTIKTENGSTDSINACKMVSVALRKAILRVRV